MRPVSGSARHCEQCNLAVHELSSLTEAEARALLAERPHERLCVRYRVVHGGRIRFADSQPLRAATLAVTLLSACATVQAEPAVEDPADEFDGESLYPHLMGIVDRISPAEWTRMVLLPPDPIPMFPKQPAPLGTPPDSDVKPP